MTTFPLQATISPSDNEFRKSLGIDVWNQMHSNLIQKYEYICQGCGWYARKENELMLHVIFGNVNDIPNSEYTILCLACHATQHIDKAAEKKWIKLCCSCYSQADLIKRCRSDEKVIKSDLSNNNVILLNRSPLEYANDIKESVLKKDNKIKVIITDLFNWSLCGKISVP